MILFENTTTQISPCIVSKIRFALGLKVDKPNNKKTCSREYWEKAIKSVSKKYSVNDDVKILYAISLFEKMTKNKLIVFLLPCLLIINCKKSENYLVSIQEGEKGTVCYYEKKKADMTITYQEMKEGEEKFGVHTTWRSQCCKSDEKYYFTKVLGMPEKWYESGKTCN